MNDPWNPPQQGSGTPPQYSWQQVGNEQYGWVPFSDGPPGQVRSTATVLLLSVVTFGIYTYVYNYKVHDEMKRHSDRGLGGGIALMLTFVAGVAMPFLTPNEVGNLYARKGLSKPVSPLTGLWVAVPGILGYVVFLATFLTGDALKTNADGTLVHDFPVARFLTALLVFFVAAVTGGIVWLVKTNGALNRYWETLARGGFSAPSP